MSASLTLASVTAVLKSLLENGLVDQDVTTQLGVDVLVSAQPVDRLETGAEAPARINIFLYQIALKGISGASRHRPGESPGALSEAGGGGYELSYLLSAYGSQDLHTEALLGSALQTLHERAALDRSAIVAILKNQASDKGGRVVASAQTAVGRLSKETSLESIRIAPQNLKTEELVNLWSSTQAGFRTALSYKVSATLRDAGPSDET